MRVAPVIFFGYALPVCRPVAGERPFCRGCLTPGHVRWMAWGYCVKPGGEPHILQTSISKTFARFPLGKPWGKRDVQTHWMRWAYFLISLVFDMAQVSNTSTAAFMKTVSAHPMRRPYVFRG